MCAFNYINKKRCEGKEKKERETKEKMAQQAAERYFQLPGFNKYPLDCFHVIEEELDEDSGWTEGFINWEGNYK